MLEHNSHCGERLELKTHSNLIFKHSKAFIVVKSQQASHIKSQRHMFLYNCTKVFSSFNTKKQAREMKYLKPTTLKSITQF